MAKAATQTHEDSAPNPQARPKRDMVSIVRKGTDGTLETVMVTKQTAHKITSLGQVSGAAYLDKVFKNAGKFDESEAFYKVFNRLECLICEDSGMVSLPMKAGDGQSYSFAFQCVCQLEKPQHTRFGGGELGNVDELVRQGLFDAVCRIGGPSGKMCYHNSRTQGKCYGCRCPKFGTI